MGNQPLSKPSSATLQRATTPMALAALSTKMALNEADLLELIHFIIEEDPDEVNLTRSDLHNVLNKLRFTQSGLDRDVLDNLFTMLDKTGDDTVNRMIFFCGVAPLAVVGTVQEKLEFALKIADVDRTGSIRVEHALILFETINEVAGYLGDCKLSTMQVEKFVSDTFGDHVSVKYTNKRVLTDMLQHPQLVIFVEGNGSEKYDGT